MCNLCPPYLKIRDVVMMMTSSSQDLSLMAIVRKVFGLRFVFYSLEEKQRIRKSITLGPLLEQDYFVGEVDLCMLEVVIEVLDNFKRYMAYGITKTTSWHSIKRLLDDAHITYRHQNEPLEWVWWQENTLLP
jgi:hypothetical protein